MSCYVIWAVSFIGPGENFGGNLPLEHPYVLQEHLCIAVKEAVWGNSVVSWCEWACAVWGPQPSCLDTWGKLSRSSWVPWYLLQHPACSHFWSTQKNKAGDDAWRSWCVQHWWPLLFYWFFCVCYSLFNRSSRVQLVLVHWRREWACLLCIQEFLKVLAGQNEPYTSKHSLPFLPGLSLATVADFTLNAFIPSRRKRNWKENNWKKN